MMMIVIAVKVILGKIDYTIYQFHCREFISS